jgi:hypothetical protein
MRFQVHKLTPSSWNSNLKLTPPRVLSLKSGGCDDPVCSSRSPPGPSQQNVLLAQRALLPLARGLEGLRRCARSFLFSRAGAAARGAQLAARGCRAKRALPSAPAPPRWGGASAVAAAAPPCPRKRARIVRAHTVVDTTSPPPADNMVEFKFLRVVIACFLVKVIQKGNQEEKKRHLADYNCA